MKTMTKFPLTICTAQRESVFSFITLSFLELKPVTMYSVGKHLNYAYNTRNVIKKLVLF